MTIKAYGYTVVGSKEVLDEILQGLSDPTTCINWFNFKTGDRYFDDNGFPYDVVADHENKTIALV